MEKKLKKVGEYVFEEGEAYIALHCLDYVAGRFKRGKGESLKKYVRNTRLDILRKHLREAIGKTD